MAEKKLHIALVGNPNSGKSTLFNTLTGLNQKVGNFPGVTVDKKTAIINLEDGSKAELIDLPGTYSLYPRRADEWVAYKVLIDADEDIKADIILLLVDASNLKRNLLFCSQIIDLKIPVVVALTMNDIAAKKGIKIDVDGLAIALGVPVIEISPRKNKDISQLKKLLVSTTTKHKKIAGGDFIDNKALCIDGVESVKKIFPHLSDYAAIHYLINHENFPLNHVEQKQIDQIAILIFEPNSFFKASSKVVFPPEGPPVSAIFLIRGKLFIVRIIVPFLFVKRTYKRRRDRSKPQDFLACKRHATSNSHMI